MEFSLRLSSIVILFQSLFNLLEFRRLVLNYKPPTNAQDLPRNQKVKCKRFVFFNSIYSLYVLLYVIDFWAFTWLIKSETVNLSVNSLISVTTATSYPLLIYYKYDFFSLPVTVICQFLVSL